MNDIDYRLALCAMLDANANDIARCAVYTTQDEIKLCELYTQRDVLKREYLKCDDTRQLRSHSQLN